MGLVSLCKKKQYILVDYFGTIVYRTASDAQIENQWVEYIIRKFPSLRERKLELVKKRKELYGKMYAGSGEVDFAELCSIYSGWLKEEYNLQTNIKDLCADLFDAEVYITGATQYINKKLYRLLQKEKLKGKKIVLVSDYHLPSKSYSVFFEFLGLTDFFDAVYISADYNCTIRDGALYQIVLNRLNAKVEEAIMIGDNKISDVKNANRMGIDAYHWLSLAFKIKNRCRRFINTKKTAVSVLSKHILSSADLSEYGLLLFYFEKQLLKELEIKKAGTINFLSRGGYLLKLLFEKYSKLEGKKINCNYLYNSRVINHRALNALKTNTDRVFLNDYTEYMLKHSEDGKLFLVDEGWNNSSQEMIGQVCNVETYGFYIGTFQKRKIQGICERKGLLFDVRENGSLSPYYYFFRVNCKTYEQLLQAPHGSIIGMSKNDDGTWAFEERIDEKESELYSRYIKDYQHKIEQVFLMAYYWDSYSEDKEVTLKALVKLVSKNILIFNKNKNEVLNLFDECYVENLAVANKKERSNTSKMKIEDITLKRMLSEPERLLRYITKGQRRYLKRMPIRILYYPVALLYYLYLSLSVNARNFEAKNS